MTGPGKEIERGITDITRERERGKKLALVGPPVGHWDIMPGSHERAGEDGRN
jgi:hypothetical protein